MNDAHVPDATYAARGQYDAYKDHDDHDGAQVVERHRAVMLWVAHVDSRGRVDSFCCLHS